MIVKKSLHFAGINLVSAKITKDTFSLFRFHPLIKYIDLKSFWSLLMN